MVEGNETVRRANMALYDLRYAQLDLDQLEKGATPADAERLRAIRSRLEGPARALDATMPRGPLGRCRYELLYFEQSMDGEPGTELAARLPAKRAEAQKCRDEHRKVIATLGPAVKDVRAALDEVAPEIRQRMAAHAAAPVAREGGARRSRRRRRDPDGAVHRPSPPARTALWGAAAIVAGGIAAIVWLSSGEPEPAAAAAVTPPVSARRRPVAPTAPSTAAH